MKNTILTTVYRIIRNENKDGSQCRNEIIKTTSIEEIIAMTRRELLDGNSIEVEVW